MYVNVNIMKKKYPNVLNYKNMVCEECINFTDLNNYCFFNVPF